MTGTDAREVVGRLSEAQKAALVTAYSLDELGWLVSADYHRSAKALYGSGLTRHNFVPTTLTPRGEAVRSFLVGGGDG